MQTGEEISCGFVIAGGEGAELLEVGEEVLDPVPGFIELTVERGRDQPCPAWPDHGLDAGRCQSMAHAGVGIEAAVGDQDRGLDLAEKVVGALQFGGLAAGEVERGGPAPGIGQDVNFGARAAFAAAERLAGAPFLRAPAACW